MASKIPLEDFSFKPPTPPNLSKENVVLWTSWHGKGDREVSREAATKGIDTQIVVLFLSLRKRISPEDAEIFFKNEVLVWVDELLARKQIFRVSHVLKNIGLDPDKELLCVFTNTSNRDLREYIGNHLKKLNELNDDINQAWCFLNLILDNNVLVSKYKLSEDTIDCLNKQSLQWKQEIAAKLFIRTHNTVLIPYLKAEILWKQLLSYNDVKSLKIWIDLQFNEVPASHSLPECVLKVFKSFSISTDMINELLAVQVSSNTCQTILNDLCRFGIFSQSDSNNFLSILRRVDAADDLQNIYQILSKNRSNIPVNKFLGLLIDFCLERELYHVLNVCVEGFDLSGLERGTHSSHLDLISSFRRLTCAVVDAEILCDNIFRVSSFLSDNLVEYLRANPIILLALVFFSNGDFLSILNTESFVIQEQELFEAVSSLMNDFKVLKALQGKITSQRLCTLSYYDLLERHMNVNVRDLYAFQFGNGSIPHFSSGQFRHFGYSKKINYSFYVKDLRPSTACKTFLIDQFGQVSEESLKIAEKKVYKIAVRSFLCPETVSSCVAFLEMIGASAEPLKVAIKAAKALSDFGYSDKYVTELFLNIDNDPYTILSLLESNIVDSVDFEDISNAQSFVDVVKLHDVAVRFAIHRGLKYPEGLLKQLACHNLWLPFLVVAQIRNYPVEQIKASMQSLKNPSLLEHIHHSVVHDIPWDDRNVLRERDWRSHYFPRIGVHRSVESLGQAESARSSIKSRSSLGSSCSSMGSDSLEIDILNTKTTLAQILIRCHNGTDPPRALLQACQLYGNPLLAILSTSYEPDSKIINWLTWLSVSSELCQTFTNFDTIATSATSVSGLLEKCMSNQFPKALYQSFLIFLPENPLRHFADFLTVCINLNFDTTSLKIKLDAFKGSLNKCRRYSVFAKSDIEMTYLGNKTWIENTAMVLLSSAIEFNFTSSHEEIQFVRCLCDVQIEQYVTCPSVQNLLEILTLLSELKTGARLDVGLYLRSDGTEKALLDCIDELLVQKRFEMAAKIACIGGIPLDTILIKEWQHKSQNLEHVEESFWVQSSEEFTAHNVSPGLVVAFYLEYADEIENASEKYRLLQLAYQWAKNSDLPERYLLEKRKWLAYVGLDKSRRADDSVFEAPPSHSTYREMLETLDSVPESEAIPEDVLRLLEELVKEALSKGNFWLALKLEKMFGCKCQDLNMLKMSHSLAEGILMPYQLNAEQRLLLTANGHYRRFSHRRRTFLSNRLSSLSSASLSPENVSYLPTADTVDGTPLQDTLTLLYILVEKVTVGVDIAYRIFMMYRISLNIEIPYHVIVSNSDYMKMLKDALEDDCMHKLDVVHDFIRVYRWSREEITGFICEEIVNTASKYVKSKSEEFLMWNLKMDQEFHLILQLVQENCSLLGNKIYAYASAIHKVQLSADLDFKISELALVTELLVTAHDCFTADCNMEGIALILKTCQAVVSHLLLLRSWKLIVRLLTGVGRYTEMSYVFDILRENDHFEFLLRKGSRRDNALKVALLDYLRRHCPDNRDLYKIVALHFALFSEVALLWEREAQGIVRNLIAISRLEMQNNKLNPDAHPHVLFSNTDGTRMCLNKAMENYTHATEFHLQGEKLAKAMRAAKQAELLALQMSLLKGLPSGGTTVCLLNLSQAQIVSLITKELSFDQGLILVQAYSHAPDWATVLFEQCVLADNASYLRSFLRHLSLTDGLVHDVSRKFLAANINTPHEITAMKGILRNVTSVHTKYRIASELGFTDLVEDLISGGQLAYLKDTVYKKGYKS